MRVSPVAMPSRRESGRELGGGTVKSIAIQQAGDARADLTSRTLSGPPVAVTYGRGMPGVATIPAMRKIS